MTTTPIRISALVSLLGKRVDDPEVVRFIERQPAEIDRSSYYGFVNFRKRGVSVVFKEASRVLPPEQVSDPSVLYLAAFHLYRDGYEGFAQYTGELPSGVTLGDSEAEVVRKAGAPQATGGGGFLAILKKPIPRWLRYRVDGDAVVQYQLDSDGRVDLATLTVPGTEAAGS